MAKDAYWFSHDSNAKDDPKCMILIDQLGLEGYGIYWVLVETLREQPEYKYPLHLLPVLAKRYFTSGEKFQAVVKNYGLFLVSDDDFFFSESLNIRMQHLENTREKRKQAALTRWSKTDANAMQLQCKSNALPMLSKVKESKVKESKVNLSKEYIYNEFYDLEIEKSKNNEEYIKFVKVLFGENNLKQPLRNVLKLKNQLTFAQFPLVMQKKREYNCTITSILENMENKPTLTKDYSSLQRTLLNWMKPKELRK